MRKILVLFVLCPALFWFAAAACGQQTCDNTAGAFVAVKFSITGISGDQQYLYVMAGGKILAYRLTDMTLVHSVDLPDPGPPKGAPAKQPDSGKLPPPPPPLPHGLWAGNGALYVLAGPFVYTYSVPDLTLQHTLQLPKPELPQTAGK